MQPVDPAWIKRFDNLANARPTRILASSSELPVWLRSTEDYSIWDRSNIWMLQNALVNGGENATVIALWDGEKGDKSGGTQHMVDDANAAGARVVRLDTKRLFGT